MALIKKFRGRDERGEMILYPGQPDTETEPVSFRIRPVPDDIATKLGEKTVGAETRVEYKDDIRATIHNNTKGLELVMAKCCYALMDTQNGDISIENDEALELVVAHKIVSKETAKLGDVVRMDGRWNDALKTAMLLQDVNFRQWVLDESAKLSAMELKAEVGKGKTS